MDNRKTKILEILNNSSSRLRETYFIRNYSETHNDIISFISKIDDIGEISFPEKIWYWVNDLNKPFTCKCGKRTTFNKNWLDGYRKSCSAKCAQTDKETKEKRKNTTIEKYGVDNIAKLDSIKEKTENTNMERYGTKSTFQNPEVRDKWSNTIMERYGVDHYFKTDEFKIKTKKYYLQKHGVEHQLNIDEVKEQIKKTCLLRYGVDTYLNTEHSRNSIKKINRSSHEDVIISWLLSIGIDENDIITTEKQLLKPLHLDIYLPKYKLAIEFNGLYWHSELFKSKNYHLDKSLKCEENGIHLLHIWEDDWKNSKDIIKSIILNKLSKIETKIYARKCEIRIVNNEDTSIFLNENHIQGYANFNTAYGLYFNDELVSLMCFGWRSINGNREYELIRFCNKKNTNIIGAASKLFSFFIKNNNHIDKMISYADRSMFTGDMYKSLGFIFTHRTNGNYWWVVNGLRKHRFTYNKKKLVKMGHDPLKTEVEIMHEMGNYRIFGCGQDKWTWNRFI